MSTSDPERAYHHGELRGALVAAALADLEAGGEAGLSLRAVARACGVSAMAPYRHFADKDALLAAVAERGFDDLGDRLAAADASAEGASALAAQGAAYVAFALARPALFRLMFMGAGGLGAGGRAEGSCADGSCAYRILSERCAALAGPAMSAEDLTLTAWSLVHGLAALILDRRVSVDAAGAEALARRITTGFARLAAGG
ncbi:TetR/AcrR family transcriptional regulator [Methylobacterium sp. NEAU 140]|uniref:TetR/AcrR family transcriptional regulator n=1 Tax=Methylobacterium sp. NEAU 140 TaxID=3064945 RepID=UPI002733E83E|nr:TetR/AcrR family transcriptional regulator [Methylobacterium sp. NEAU 140]MDP4023423.1 TetR/AcrR family transcriptional regulator [Methylobacterium sp. NEAU 140]